MKDAIKAVIRKGEKSFFKQGELTLYFSGEHHEALKGFIRARGLVPGSPVVVKFQDKESKSAKQNRTYRLLVSIAFKSGLFGNDYDRLHNCFKQVYGGVYKDWEDFAGKQHSDLESTANYTMPQMAKLITGTIDHVLRVFNESDYYDKRLDEMMQEFNSQPVEPDKEIELY